MEMKNLTGASSLPMKALIPMHKGVDNLEWEDHSNVTVEDIREPANGFKIDDCGFQVFDHESKFMKFETASDVADYKSETEKLLKEKMRAVYVKCYDSRLRKNIPFQRTYLDLNDPLLTEGPARGAHNGKSEL
jgi:hypothetical protein